MLWSRDPELCTLRAQLCALFVITHTLVLHLREPPGQTPIRIRLLGPWTLKESAEVPLDGLLIDSTEWWSEPGSSEGLTVHFANGRTLRATCKQVALDVS